MMNFILLWLNDFQTTRTEAPKRHYAFLPNLFDVKILWVKLTYFLFAGDADIYKSKRSKSVNNRL